MGGNPQIHLYYIESSEDKPSHIYDGHTNNVTAVGFQSDQKWIYSGSEDGTIKIWDPRSNGPHTRSYDCQAPVNTVALSPNQAVLISGDQNGCVIVWNLEQNCRMESFQPAPEVPIRSISIASDASLIAVGLHRGKVIVYNKGTTGSLSIDQTNPLELLSSGDEYLLKCVISPDVSLIATTSSDKTVKIWNALTGELLKTLIGHQKWVWDAVFSADSSYLVTTSSDLTGKLWDLRTPEPGKDILRSFVGHSGAVTCIALSDNSS